VKIAGRRNPLPAKAPPALGLPPSHDPKRAALAFGDESLALIVGGIHLVEGKQPNTARARFASQFQACVRFQNSDFAAAVAAFISGAGYTQKHSRKIDETASTARGVKAE
jgi:hypothetical protein